MAGKSHLYTMPEGAQHPDFQPDDTRFQLKVMSLFLRAITFPLGKHFVTIKTCTPALLKFNHLTIVKCTFFSKLLHMSEKFCNFAVVFV